MTASPSPRDSAQGRAQPTLLIDLDAIVENWRFFNTVSEARAAAVVKADAYGCGASQVASALERAGCDVFFTATLTEAARLAEGLRSGSAVYVLDGPPADEAWPDDRRIRPVLNTLEQARRHLGRDRERRAALHIETGMNRLALPTADWEAVAALAAGRPEAISLVMSHLASADAWDDGLLRAQADAFAAAAPRLRAAFPRAALSLAATAAAVLARTPPPREDPHAAGRLTYDLLRPGVGLYGGAPHAQARPVVRLTAPILQVATREVGARSGYGGDWVADRPSLLATAALGYADGLPRALGGRGQARINGRLAPIAGRISMDLTVLDVTDFPDPPRSGDIAEFLALDDPALSIDAMAGQADTIGYEILTRLDAAGRLRRLWRGGASEA
ncbi:MAG: alanine racemase [Pseudomonadota bacterium]